MNPKSSRYFTYIRPIMRSKFTKTYSSLIFSLITIFIFSFYAIRPTVTTILSLQKSIGEQSEVVNKLQEKVNSLSEGTRNYENLDGTVKTKIGNLVPDNPDLAALIDSITNAANTAEASVSGLQFQTVKLENKKTQIIKGASLNEIDFALNIQGNFQSLMRLLTTLKKSDRLIKITSVNLTQPPDSSLIMSLNGKAYFIKN